MSWLDRFRKLRARGILGMNRRNAECILDHNPRSRYPLVDSKSKMHELCLSLGVPTPDLYASIAAHSARLRGSGCPRRARSSVMALPGYGR